MDAEPQMQKKKSEGRRITIRLSEEDYRKLCELRLALYLDSDSHAVRRVIRWHHAASKRALALVQRLPGHAKRVRALMEGRDV